MLLIEPAAIPHWSDAMSTSMQIKAFFSLTVALVLLYRSPPNLDSADSSWITPTKIGTIPEDCGLLATMNDTAIIISQEGEVYLAERQSLRRYTGASSDISRAEAIVNGGTLGLAYILRKDLDAYVRIEKTLGRVDAQLKCHWSLNPQGITAIGEQNQLAITYRRSLHKPPAGSRDGYEDSMLGVLQIDEMQITERRIKAIQFNGTGIGWNPRRKLLACCGVDTRKGQVAIGSGPGYERFHVFDVPSLLPLDVCWSADGESLVVYGVVDDGSVEALTAYAKARADRSLFGVFPGTVLYASWKNGEFKELRRSPVSGANIVAIGTVRGVMVAVTTHGRIYVLDSKKPEPMLIGEAPNQTGCRACIGANAIWVTGLKREVWCCTPNNRGGWHN